MKRLIATIPAVAFSFLSNCQGNTWSVKFSDAMISRYTPTINAMTSKGWEYSNTIILHGMEKVFNKVNTPAYLNYVKAFIDSYLNSNGTFKAGVSLVSLDRVHPGISCLFLYEQLKSNSADSLKYRTAATAIRNVLVGPSASYAPYRTPIKKIFWHKQSGYDNIMMLDGMYMAHPFLAKYGHLFGDAAAIDTAVNQTLFAYTQLYVSGTKLVKHAWKEPGSSGSVAWDDAAGNSTSVWSRAMGWYTMALVDILKYVPPSHPRRTELLTALGNIAAGLKNFQDPTSRLWFHVVDKTSATLSGNYLETSGSAMFVYALKTAVDSGWISSATYLPVAQSGWTGLQAKIGTYSDGKPQINDFSPAMSVQNTEALYVQASLQPVDCPAPSGTQHPHGYAAILMAASVMEFSSTLPTRFLSLAVKEYETKTVLTWQVADEEDVAHYIIEKSGNTSSFSVIGTVIAGHRGEYHYDDAATNEKTSYYRVRSVHHDGSFKYSPVVAVTRTNDKDLRLKIFPNPNDGNNLNLSLEHIAKGNYQIKILGASGIVVHHQSLVVPEEGGFSIVVGITPVINPGIYYVQLTGNGLKHSAGFTVQ